MEIIAQNDPQARLSLLQAKFEVNREHGQELGNSRINRGYRLATEEKIVQVDANTWMVEGTETYTVTFFTAWDCNCRNCQDGHDPDCNFKGKAPTTWFMGSYGPVCKHITAVALTWLAEIELPQVTLPQADFAKPRKYNRATTCETCHKDWQECDCQPAPLPAPAKITRYSKKSQELLESILPTEAEEEAAERALQAALKPEGRRQTRANFGRYSY